VVTPKPQPEPAGTTSLAAPLSEGNTTIIFFTTGLHPDYHANTDEVSKIESRSRAGARQPGTSGRKDGGH
jgi:hypothetical protein